MSVLMHTFASQLVAHFRRAKCSDVHFALVSLNAPGLPVKSERDPR